MGSQHKGNYLNPETGEGRVFNVLNAFRNRWFSTRDINRLADTVCASTYISSLDAQLPRGLSIERKKERNKRRVTWWYRLISHTPDGLRDLAHKDGTAIVYCKETKGPVITAFLPFGE